MHTVCAAQLKLFEFDSLKGYRSDAKVLLQRSTGLLGRVEHLLLHVAIALEDLQIVVQQRHPAPIWSLDPHHQGLRDM